MYIFFITAVEIILDKGNFKSLRIRANAFIWELAILFRMELASNNIWLIELVKLLL